MSNMQKMKTLTLQDVMFEITDQKAREDISANAKDIATNFKNTEANSDRISALENDLVAIDDFIKTAALTDPAFTSTKSVPSNSAPYAEVVEIGGMTRKCTNLIPFPYTFSSFDLVGVSGSINEDQTVRLNGTSTGNIYRKSVEFSLPTGTYTVSFIQPNEYTRVILYKNGNAYKSLAKSDPFFTFNADNATDKYEVDFVILSGGTFVNSVIGAMLNSGTTALPYEPYFEGLRSAPVTEVESVGVNLFDIDSVTLGINASGDSVSYRALSAFFETQSDKMTVRAQNLPSNLKYMVRQYMSASVEGDMGPIGDWITDTADHVFTFNQPYCAILFGSVDNATLTEADFEGLELMLNRGTTAKPYTSYVRNTLPIPEAIQNLDGYGWGINESIYNYVDFEKKQFVKRLHKIVVCGKENIGYTGEYFVLYPDLKQASNLEGLLFSRNDVSGFLGISGIGIYFDGADSAEEFKTFFQANPMEIIYELATPVITDISDLLPDGAISVEDGGTVTMVNEYGYDVPNEITFYTGNQEVGVAQVFVGDLIGKATHATHDSEGNEIANTYAAVTKDVVSNDDSAKAKEIPSNSAPYAEVVEIGGMTRKCANLLDVLAYCKNAGEPNSDGSVTIVASGSFNCDVNYTGKLPSGTYTVSNLSGKKIYILFSSGDYSNGIEVGGTKTFTYDGVSYLRFIGNDQSASESVTYKVMLNEGTTALPYEPYFEGLRSAPVTEVESVGANLFDGDAFANKIVELGGAKDESVGTAYISSSNIRGMIVKSDFDANTQYTFILKVHCPSADNISLCIRYTDRTTTYLKAIEANTPVTICLVSASGKSIKSFEGAHQINTTYYYNECGIFKGVLTAEDFKPYVRNTLPIPEAVRNLDGYGWGINESIYNYVDFEKKRFVKRVGCVDMGTFDWILETNSSGVTFFQTVATVDVADSANGRNILCAPYTPVVNREHLTDKTISPRNTAAINRMCVCDSAYTDVATFKAAMSGVMLYYELAKPIITDISNLLPDGAIAVEEGGTITMVNEFGYDVPNTIDFYIGKNEVIAADTFAGDLVGTASRAVCDKDGNPISSSYARYADANGSLKANASGQSPSVSLLRNSRFTFDENDVPTVEGETVWVLK